MSKVFVIDDSVSACVAIERMLGGQGFDVIWEKDAITALRTVEKYVPDLVICDVILPDIDGFEICRSLRANPLLNGVPVMLISGVVDDGVLEQARAAGAATVVAKPFTAEQLTEAVQAILGALTPPKPDEPEATLPEALRQRVSAELETLLSLGSRSIYVTDERGHLMASIGSPQPGPLSSALEQEIATQRMLATAARDLHGSATARLTLETEDGVRIVELLDASYALVVQLEGTQLLGKARFLIRRLRSRLGPILRAK